MSLVVATYVPEGMVLASDSRQTITIESKAPDGRELPKTEIINSYNVYKTYLLTKRDKSGVPIYEVGVSSYGQDLLGGISIASHVKRFAEEQLKEDDDVSTIPAKLFAYFKTNFPDADTGFHLVGYRKDGKVSVPYVYICHIGKNIPPERKNVKPDGSIYYGCTWSGQIDIISGIFQPSLFPGQNGKPVTMYKPPVIWDAMALQDAIDFSIYAIRTTIDTIRFQARPKTVGGAIDVLVITPEGAEWIQRKERK